MRLSVVEASQLAFIHSLLRSFVLSIGAISWAPGLVDTADGTESGLESPCPPATCSLVGWGGAGRGPCRPVGGHLPGMAVPRWALVLGRSCSPVSSLAQRPSRILERAAVRSQSPGAAATLGGSVMSVPGVPGTAPADPAGACPHPPTPLPTLRFPALFPFTVGSP